MTFRNILPGLIAAGVLLSASAVCAHTVLQGSSPPAGATVQTLREIVLTFSEPVDPAFSTATVATADGRRVSEKPTVGAGGRRMTVPLEDVVPGVYTVRWRALSAVDGHATSGFFLFTVAGQAAPAQPAPQPAPAAPSPQPEIAAPSTAQVFVRWVNFAAAILLAGTVFFQYFVLRPGLARLDPQEVALAQVGADRLLRAVSSSAAGALLLGLLAEFLLQAATLLDTTLAGVWRSGTLWVLLGGTKLGWSTLVRAAGAAVLLLPPTPSGRILRSAALVWFVIIGTVAALLGGPVVLAGSIHLAVFVLVATVYGLISVMAAVIVPGLADARIPEVPVVGPIAAAIVLGGITVSSHAMGSGVTAVVLDWVHLVAAALWIGGLLPLWLVLRTAPDADREIVARVLMPKFSQVAAVALAALAVTGVYSALVHIPALRAFTVTPYGRTLLVKLILVVAAVALGTYNRFVLRRRLEGTQPAGGTSRRLLRSVGIEVALGATVLLVVALLTITPPAAVTMPAPTRPPLVLAGLAGPFRVELGIAPGEPGWNRVSVVVRSPEGTVGPAETRILLRLLKLDEDLGLVTVTLRPEGDRFVAEGADLGLPGWWEVQVVVRQRGATDVSTPFPLRLGVQSGRPLDLQAQRLLSQAREAAARVRTWREVEQLTDGAGGVTVTDFQMLRPDRLRYRTASGAEAVILGATRYYRQGGGPWERDTLPSPIALEGPYMPYLQNPAAAGLGRRGRCDGEPCRVATWELPSGRAAFAAWIGLESFRIYRLYMTAPYHYMTSRALDLNTPLTIAPP